MAAVAACSAVALSLFASPAAANTITVSSTADGVSGSLREAIEEVEPGGTVIVPAGTYVLTLEQLSPNKSMTIAGAGAGSTVITAKGGSRLFKIVGKALSVTISGVTLTEGTEEEPGEIVLGGGIFDSEAALTLEHAVVSHNLASTDGGNLEGGGISKGGGIYATGPLRLSDVTLSDDVASARGGSASGGGIAEGGAVWSTGGATLESVTFAQNTANADGGSVGGSLSEGGGIAEGGAAMLRGEGTSVTLSSVTAAGNAASSAGGGSSDGGISRGGGLYMELESGSGSISALTASGNSALAPGGTGAGGGIAEGGGLRVIDEIPLTIANATVTGNVASNGGGSGDGEGGGIWTSGTAGDTTIVSSTLDANTVAGPPSGGGGGNLEGEANVRDTIISGGVGPASHQNCGDPVHSLGNNLEDRDECGLHAPGDKVGVGPQLGALQANGGLLSTQAPAQSSPAVDAGASCAPTDARGVARPQGPACDIGAYELALPSATTGGATVTATTATLAGSGSNPDLLAGTGFFQVGLTTAYGAQSSATGIGPGIAGSPFAATIGGLKAGTLYHYRAVATNPDGIVAGSDRTFTTAAANRAAAPVLSGLALRPSLMHAQKGHGASLAKRRGAALVYKDSQAGTTKLTVLRVRRGYRVHGSCRASRPRHAKGHLHRCTRLLAVGSFSHADKGGAVSAHFTGRVGGHALAPGSYKLRAQAHSKAGLASNVLTISFSVAR